MENVKEKYYKRLADAVGGAEGERIAEAIRDLYTLYKPEMIDWFAGLYDVKRGGYYYSNGARDNEKIHYQGVSYDLLPDAESTEQALRFIKDSGLLGEGKTLKEALPEWMKKDIVRFIKGMQNENGFFYHPQWPKELTDTKLSRRARDLSWSVEILDWFGSRPTYDTPTGVKGDGLDADGNPVKKAVEQEDSENGKPKSAVAVPPELENKESFIKYLNSLDIKHESYPVGNMLTAITGQIIYRDKELEAQGADYSLRKIIIEWLNENQNPENGLWHDKANYYGVNGLMKTSGVYGKIGVLLPNADKAVKSAIDAIGTEEVPDAVTCIYNSWYAVNRIKSHLRSYGGEEGKKMADKIVADMRAMAPEAIRITKEKLKVFAKPYGSFSYTPTSSAPRSQTMPVTFRGAYEGDVNATIICSSDILYYIYSALELWDVRVPVYSPEDLERYIDIIEKKR